MVEEINRPNHSKSLLLIAYIIELRARQRLAGIHENFLLFVNNLSKHSRDTLFRSITMHLKRAIPLGEVKEDRLCCQLQLECFKGSMLLRVHDNSPLRISLVLDILSSQSIEWCRNFGELRNIFPVVSEQPKDTAQLMNIRRRKQISNCFDFAWVGPITFLVDNLAKE